MTEQLTEVLRDGLPWWATSFAAVLLALAAQIARRMARRSTKPQGERLGSAEQLLTLEATRRRQLESILVERYGVELPWWPPDGDPPPAPLPRRDEVDDRDRYEVDDREPETTRTPAIPPLPDYSHHRR